PSFSGADFKIAIVPVREGFSLELIPGIQPDLTLAVTLGASAKMDVASIECIAGDATQKIVPRIYAAVADADVFLTSGGDTGWQETLEEALLSLHVHRPSAETAVLSFSGAEGLGSAR